MIRWGLLYGLFIGMGYLVTAAVLMGGCYKSGPTPPCTVNSPNPACPDWPHDQRKPAK